MNKYMECPSCNFKLSRKLVLKKRQFSCPNCLKILIRKNDRVAIIISLLAQTSPLLIGGLIIQFAGHDSESIVKLINIISFLLFLIMIKFSFDIYFKLIDIVTTDSD